MTEKRFKEIPAEEALQKMMVLNRGLHDRIEELEDRNRKLLDKNLSFRERVDECEEICEKMIGVINDFQKIIKEMRV